MSEFREKILNCHITEKQIAVFYLGQEGFIFKTNGVYVAIDPYLSDYVDKNCSATVKWERLYEPPCKAEDLDFVDYVFLTHTHYDHSDPLTIKGILSVNDKVKFVVPKAELATYLSYGIMQDRIICAVADEMISLKNKISVTPIPSAHEIFHTDENGNYKELGYIFDFNCGKFFHAGDMCMYNGLISRLVNIDIAFLPVNGRDYFRNVNDIIGNFDSVEAVNLVKIANISKIVPIHHDLYEVNRVSNSYFLECLDKLDSKKEFHIFRVGEKYIFER